MDWRRVLVPGPARLVVFLFLALTLPLFSVDVDAVCSFSATTQKPGFRLLTTVPCEDDVPPRISLVETWSVDFIETEDLKVWPGVMFLPFVYAALPFATWAAVPRSRWRLPMVGRTHWILFGAGLLSCASLYTHWYNAGRGGIATLSPLEESLYYAVEWVSVVVLPFFLLRAHLLGPGLAALQSLYAGWTGTLSISYPIGYYPAPGHVGALPLALHTLLLAVAFWYLAAGLAGVVRHIVAAWRRRKTSRIDEAARLPLMIAAFPSVTTRSKRSRAEHPSTADERQE